MVDKKAQAAKCVSIVAPRVRLKLNDFRQAIRNWRPIEAKKDAYEVQHTHNSNISYAVRLDKKNCACRYWDLYGIPCEHATTALCAKNETPENYVSCWYNKDTYEAAYSFSLEPINGQALWEKIDEGPISPSDPRVKHGRPANKRNKAYGEGKRKTHLCRVVKSGKQLCSSCKEPGHKITTCP
ncbi:uncharacterized protein LOC110706753 [Chenopodium quinoa]|uniref:uncharacterized protein LOC110706753 n=1 Tax=Chenopodium quinoa TaxID=63459 RepID=UPI000B7824C8|nr:uncharacterized protein LOC110706753 [Chenopodium quinoa]